MGLNKGERAAIQEFCNLFPEVRWDRYCHYPHFIAVFGWIDRDDGRSDYMEFTIQHGKCLQYMTTSARYSTEFGQRLADHIGGVLNHRDCKRVEYLRLPVRSIKLKKGGR